MKVCAFCGDSFYTKPSNRWKKFCSKSCCTQFHLKRLHESRIVDKTCLFCGKSFKSFYKVQRYCSSSCGTMFHNERRRGVCREFVYADKLAKGCSRCPERRPSCLQYHHVDPSKKELGIGVIVARGLRLEILVKEIKKCILLCANCHFVEENGDGYKNEDRPDVS